MKEIKFSAPKPVVVGSPEDTRDFVDLPINGQNYYAFEPSPNSVALFYEAMGSKGMGAKLAAVTDFLEANVEPEAVAIIRRAVKDEVLDYGEQLQLCQAIITEFSANPTGSPDDSSTSRETTGRASRASSQPRAQTRQRSRSASSTPRSTTS